LELVLDNYIWQHTSSSAKAAFGDIKWPGIPSIVDRNSKCVCQYADNLILYDKGLKTSWETRRRNPRQSQLLHFAGSRRRLRRDAPGGI